MRFFFPLPGVLSEVLYTVVRENPNKCLPSSRPSVRPSVGRATLIEKHTVNQTEVDVDTAVITTTVEYYPCVLSSHSIDLSFYPTKLQYSNTSARPDSPP